MKLTAADFPRLQYSLLGALLMLAIGAGVLYFAIDSTSGAARERLIAQNERDDAGRKLQRIRLEEGDIRQKSLAFNELRARGVIGDERRLEWVELLKAIRLQRELPDLQYEIAPQRPLDPVSGSGYGFFASAMKIQVKLLHEEDLTRLLADLRAQARALIVVRSCDMSRLPVGGEEAGAVRGVPASLRAECLIDWVTVREVAAK